MPNKQPMIVDGVELWRCSRCKEYLPAEAFTVQNYTSSGLTSACRECQSKDCIAARKDPDTRRMRLDHERRYTARVRPRRQAAIRKWQIDNKERVAASSAAWAASNKASSRASGAVKKAIRKGLLIKPDKCEVCAAARLLQGHHPSYDRDRWLTVTWMCVRCHRWTHARLKDQQEGIW